jgi:hypothetical protein
MLASAPRTVHLHRVNPVRAVLPLQKAPTHATPGFCHATTAPTSREGGRGMDEEADCVGDLLGRGNALHWVELHDW